jgi:hypothetical protein
VGQQAHGNSLLDADKIETDQQPKELTGEALEQVMEPYQ